MLTGRLLQFTLVFSEFMFLRLILRFHFLCAVFGYIYNCLGELELCIEQL